jgi:hypothetical protein
MFRALVVVVSCSFSCASFAASQGPSYFVLAAGTSAAASAPVADLSAAEKAALPTAAISASAIPAAGPPPAADNGSWKNDNVKLGNDVVNVGGPVGRGYFAPDGSVFIVTDDDEKTHTLTVKFRNITVMCDKNGNGTIELDNTDSHTFLYDEKDKTRRIQSGCATVVDSHNLYTMDKAAVEKMNYTRHGWAIGMLAVPYKFQLHDKSISSALSLGPYVGYRTENGGTALAWVVSAGLINNIPVAQVNGTGSVNRSGFSLATGLIFSIKKGTGIEVGLLVGQDRLGSNSSAPYPYEGKTWVSVAVGYKFL